MLTEDQLEQYCIDLFKGRGNKDTHKNMGRMNSPRIVITGGK